MRCGSWAKLVVALPLLSALVEAGVTILIGIDNCPATTTGLPTSNGLPTNTAVTTPTPTGTGTAAVFLLQVVAPVRGKQKRQTGSNLYVGPNGNTMGSCSAALGFVFSGQELLSGGSPVAVGPGVNYAPLAPTPPGILGRTINSAFSTNANSLVWYNALFDNGGFAAFCITNTSVVEVVFHGDAPPGCSAINVVVVSASTCPGYANMTTSVTGSSTGTTGSISTVSTSVTSLTSQSTGGSTSITSPTFTPSTSTATSTHPSTSLTSASSSTTSSTISGGTTATSSGTISTSTSFSSATTSSTPGTTSSTPGTTSSTSTLTSSSSSTHSTTSTASSSSSTVTSTSATSSISSSSHSTTSTTSTATSASISSSTSTHASTSTTSTGITATASATDYPCPNYNGQSFSAGNNNYNVVCQADLLGTDIASGSGASLLDCINLCNIYNTINGAGACTGVVYLKPNLYCYLKNAITGTQSGSTVDSALLVCNNCPSVSVSTSTTATVTPTTATTATTPTITTITSTSGSSSTSSSASTSSTATGATTTSTISTTTSSSTATVTDYPCPAYNAQSFSEGSSSYNIACQTDLSGADIGSGPGTTLQDCLNLCNEFNSLNGPNACTGAVFLSSNSYCYLKNGITGTQSLAGRDSGLLICNTCPSFGASTSSTPTATTASTPTSTITRSSTSTSTIISSSTTTSTIISSSTTTSTSSASAATDYPCGTFNGQSFTAGDSTYNIFCGVDQLSSDPNVLSSAGATLSDCLTLCNTYNAMHGAGACKAAVYFQEFCYLKDNVVGTQSSPGVDSGVLICDTCSSVSASTTTATSSTSTVSTATTATTPTSTASASPAPQPAACPGRNGDTYQSPDNVIYEILCSTDFTGNTITQVRATTLQNCANACDAYNDGNPNTQQPCVGASFEENLAANMNNCFLKYNLTSTPDTSVNTTDSIVQRNHYDQSLCPQQNGGFYSSPDGKVFQILCGQDLSGSGNADISRAQGGAQLVSSFQACAQACDAYNTQSGTTTCVGLTYVENIPTDNPNNLNCFLKDAVAPANATYVMDIDSMVLITGPTRIILSHPTPLQVNYPGNGYNQYGSISTTLPFPLVLYDLNDTFIYVATTGVLSITDDLNDSNTNSNLPDLLSLPKSAACGYWGNSYALENTQQGVYYQIDGYTVSFEYILTTGVLGVAAIHFIIFYDSYLTPGVFNYYYFNATDNGAGETVGTQGVHNGVEVANVYDEPQPLGYMSVTPGLFVQFNTPRRTSSVGSFDPSSCPPGTWPNCESLV